MARYTIIHNPISGEGRAARLVRDIGAELRAHGHEVADLCPRSREEAARAAREIDASCDGLVSVGGDGTHNTIIGGLVGRPVPLLPVPAGTENLLAKSVGIPRDPAVIREVLEAGRIRTIDVGLANGRAFAVMSGVGFDATVTGEVHRKRTGPIRRFYYFWPTLRNWCFYRWPHMDIDVDGEPVARGAAFLVVGNMRLYADGLRICPDALPDDGLLDVCIFTRPGRWQLVGYFLSTRLGRHLKRRDVVYRQCRSIVVRPEEPGVPFQVDGDAVGVAPVEYAVQPKAIQLFVRAFQ